MSRIKITSTRQPAIRNTSTTVERIEPEQLSTALGAQEVATEPLRGSPPALLGLRQELCRRLQSTGGRPALQGTSRRQKIPLTDEDWGKLVALAEQSRTEDFRPTPGQIASILLRKAIEDIERQSA